MRSSDRTPHLLSEDEGVPHQVNPRRGRGDVVEGVGRLQLAVGRVGHDGGRQRVEGDEVGQLAGRVLHDKALDDVLAGHEPVGEVVVGEDRRQLVLPEELMEETRIVRKILGNRVDLNIRL